MTVLFVILIILASVILGFIVLVQNPKGGGLAGNIAGFSSQFMGVKQTTDVLEKGTWLFAGLIGVLSLVSTFFITGRTSGNDNLDKIGNPTQTTAPATNPGTLNTPPGTSPVPDTNKK